MPFLFIWTLFSTVCS